MDKLHPKFGNSNFGKKLKYFTVELEKGTLHVHFGILMSSHDHKVSTNISFKLKPSPII